MVLVGIVKVSCTPSPACCALRSAIAVGTGGEGAVGSPGAPHPASRTPIEKRNAKGENPGRLDLCVEGRLEFRLFICGCRNLQNVAAQILILDDVGELLVDVRR